MEHSLELNRWAWSGLEFYASRGLNVQHFLRFSETSLFLHIDVSPSFDCSSPWHSLLRVKLGN